MIEVEIKCKPTPEQMAALLKDATFVSEEHLTDIYYDSATYELSTKDFWLRTRNDKFVLKIPAFDPTGRVQGLQQSPKSDIKAPIRLLGLLFFRHHWVR